MENRIRRQLFNDKTLCDRLGLSRSAFYRYLQKGILTEPVGKLAKNRRGWSEQDIEVARMELQQIKEKE